MANIYFETTISNYPWIRLTTVSTLVNFMDNRKYNVFSFYHWFLIFFSIFMKSNTSSWKDFHFSCGEVDDCSSVVGSTLVGGCLVVGRCSTIIGCSIVDDCSAVNGRSAIPWCSAVDSSTYWLFCAILLWRRVILYLARSLSYIDFILLIKVTSSCWRL